MNKKVKQLVAATRLYYKGEKAGVGIARSKLNALKNPDGTDIAPDGYYLYILPSGEIADGYWADSQGYVLRACLSGIPLNRDEIKYFLAEVVEAASESFYDSFKKNLQERSCYPPYWQDNKQTICLVDKWASCWFLPIVKGVPEWKLLRNNNED